MVCEIEKWNKNKEHLEIMDDNRMPKWRLFNEIVKRPNLTLSIEMPSCLNPRFTLWWLLLPMTVMEWRAILASE